MYRAQFNSHYGTKAHQSVFLPLISLLSSSLISPRFCETSPVLPRCVYHTRFCCLSGLQPQAYTYHLSSLFTLIQHVVMFCKIFPQNLFFFPYLLSINLCFLKAFHMPGILYKQDKLKSLTSFIILSNRRDSYLRKEFNQKFWSVTVNMCAGYLKSTEDGNN